MPTRNNPMRIGKAAKRAPKAPARSALTAGQIENAVSKLRAAARASPKIDQHWFDLHLRRAGGLMMNALGYEYTRSSAGSTPHYSWDIKKHFIAAELAEEALDRLGYRVLKGRAQNSWGSDQDYVEVIAPSGETVVRSFGNSEDRVVLDAWGIVFNKPPIPAASGLGSHVQTPEVPARFLTPEPPPDVDPSKKIRRPGSRR